MQGKCKYILLLIVITVNFVECRKSREINIISVNSNYRNDLSLHTILKDSIAHSVDIALENCQKLFRWDRWNCPVADFLSKRSSTVLDRETAFVQTISMAAFIYTVARNCSRGEIKGCGCLNAHDQQQQGHLLENELSSIKTLNCSDQLEYGEQMASNLFKYTDDVRLDAQGYASIHNNRAAKMAVRNSFRKHCRCHGMSGSCAMQTCWLSLNTFPEIAADIRRMYDRSVLMSYNNKGQIDSSVREDSLVYVFDSPNYCKENAIIGWNGTAGRQCSRSKENGASLQERRSCRHLCRSCGLRIRKESVVRTKRCNCKFNWCCNVTCDVCKEHVNEYFCY